MYLGVGVLQRTSTRFRPPAPTVRTGTADAVPVLTVGAEGRVVECVEVHSKTPTPSFFFVPLSHVFGNQTQFLVFVPLSSCTEPQETG